MHGHYNDYGCEMCCSFLLRHPPLPEIPFGPSSLTTHPASPPLITLSMTSATLAWDVFQRITGHPTQIIDSSLIAITKIATSNGSKTTRCPAQPPSQRSVHPRYDTPGEARTGIVTEWRRSTAQTPSPVLSLLPDAHSTQAIMTRAHMDVHRVSDNGASQPAPWTASYTSSR